MVIDGYTFLFTFSFHIDMAHGTIHTWWNFCFVASLDRQRHTFDVEHDFSAIPMYDYAFGLAFCSGLVVFGHVH